jgi:D-alanyl-lipoteichoic acid acyltransferase DltB (MBOAT superfamily)
MERLFYSFWGGIAMRFIFWENFISQVTSSLSKATAK